MQFRIHLRYKYEVWKKRRKSAFHGWNLSGRGGIPRPTISWSSLPSVTGVTARKYLLPFVSYRITTMRNEKISYLRGFDLRAVSNSCAGSKSCGRQEKESVSAGTACPCHLKRHRKFGHRDQTKANQDIHRHAVYRDQGKWTKRDDRGSQVGHDGRRDDWSGPYSRWTHRRLGPPTITDNRRKQR